MGRARGGTTNDSPDRRRASAGIAPASAPSSLGPSATADGVANELRADPFAVLLGAGRGDNVTHTQLSFLFAEPLSETQRAKVDAYVASRLDSARARCVWLTAAHLRIDCARACTREPGIIRLHIQQLAGVTAALERETT